VRLISSFLLILCLAGCQRGGRNDTEAVRQAVVARLANLKMDPSVMDIKITSVQYNGDQADADVAIAVKGKKDAPPMSLRYHLERQNNKWIANLAPGSSHSGAADPNAGGANPHGGAMPEGVDNPHGGAMPPAGGAGNMPSPQDLPPVKKK
jgi:hypothetical protein